jgi:hypothetical protein
LGEKREDVQLKKASAARQQKTDRTILAVVDSTKEETLVSAGKIGYTPNKPQEHVFRSATMTSINADLRASLR